MIVKVQLANNGGENFGAEHRLVTLPALGATTEIRFDHSAFGEMQEVVVIVRPKRPTA